MIEVNKLVKAYNNVNVVDIESLKITQGETFGLVGNNGAGKTTFFRIMLDLVQPDAGEVLMNGENVALSENWKSFTSSYLDDDFLIGHLTPMEYFNFIAKVYGRKQTEVEEQLDTVGDFFDTGFSGSKKLIRELSKGNKHKTGIIGAMLASPKVLVLDEPFANLDPTSQFRLKKLLANFNENKESTIMISSHDLNHVSEVCARIAVIENGRIIEDFATDEQTIKKLEAYFSI